MLSTARAPLVGGGEVKSDLRIDLAGRGSAYALNAYFSVRLNTPSQSALGGWSR